MKRVTAKVQMLGLDESLWAREQAFNDLCLLLMMLKVFDEIKLVCNKGTNATRTWSVDWDYVRKHQGARVIKVESI